MSELKDILKAIKSKPNKVRKKLLSALEKAASSDNESEPGKFHRTQACWNMAPNFEQCMHGPPSSVQLLDNCVCVFNAMQRKASVIL